jgi:hypothetical protein
MQEPSALHTPRHTPTPTRVQPQPRLRNGATQTSRTTHTMPCRARGGNNHPPPFVAGHAAHTRTCGCTPTRSTRTQWAGTPPRRPAPISAGSSRPQTQTRARTRSSRRWAGTRGSGRCRCTWARPARWRTTRSRDCTTTRRAGAGEGGNRDGRGCGTGHVHAHVHGWRQGATTKQGDGPTRGTHVARRDDGEGRRRHARARGSQSTAPPRPPTPYLRSTRAVPTWNEPAGQGVHPSLPTPSMSAKCPGAHGTSSDVPLGQ